MLYISQTILENVCVFDIMQPQLLVRRDSCNSPRHKQTRYSEKQPAPLPSKPVLDCSRHCNCHMCTRSYMDRQRQTTCLFFNNPLAYSSGHHPPPSLHIVFHTDSVTYRTWPVVVMDTACMARFASFVSSLV